MEGVGKSRKEDDNWGGAINFLALQICRSRTEAIFCATASLVTHMIFFMSVARLEAQSAKGWGLMVRVAQD